MIAILAFGLLGIVQVNNPEFNVVGVPSGAVVQQITPASDIIFGASIPSYSENGILLFVLFFLLGIDAYLCSKFIKDPKMALIVFFMIALLVVSVLMGILWASIHSIVYGNSEAKTFATFIFGTIGSIITILSGTFIGWLVWHFFNNFFIKLTEFVTLKEDIILISLVIWAIVFLIYVSIEFLAYRHRKKKRSGSSDE